MLDVPAPINPFNLGVKLLDFVLQSSLNLVQFLIDDPLLGELLRVETIFLIKQLLDVSVDLELHVLDLVVQLTVNLVDVFVAGLEFLH